ncbi:MAG: serine aminopeptidase domain-containing protein [Planctomycetota bacterium]
MGSRHGRSVLRRILRGSVIALLATTAWICATVVGLIPAILVPPVVMPAGQRELRFQNLRLPQATERIEIANSNGETLRGIFVHADVGAPVVLHLLESSGSVSNAIPGYSSVLRDLSDLGFASLIVDYRGVGASDGTRSPMHLAEDAALLFREAVRRAGGDPCRVVVRALSIGTLAAATLADSGARPAYWVLIAPVRGETLLSNFLAGQTQPGLAHAAASLFRPVTDANLAEAVGRMGPDLFVASPQEDFLIAWTEQVALEVEVRRAGGAWSICAPDHVALILGAHHGVYPDEVLALRRAFPDWPDRGARTAEMLARLPPEAGARFPDGSWPRSTLEDLACSNRSASAAAIAAVAIAVDDSARAARLSAAIRRNHWLRDLDLEDALRVLDLKDPAGLLSWDLLEGWVDAYGVGIFMLPIGADLSDGLERQRGVEGALAIARISEAEAAAGRPESHSIWLMDRSEELFYPCCDTWRALLDERRLTRADARRQIVRLLLKAMSIPDRLQRSAAGDLELQAREGDDWITLSLDWPEPIASGTRPGDGIAESR